MGRQRWDRAQKVARARPAETTLDPSRTASRAQREMPQHNVLSLAVDRHEQGSPDRPIEGSPDPATTPLPACEVDGDGPAVEGRGAGASGLSGSPGRGSASW